MHKYFFITKIFLLSLFCTVFSAHADFSDRVLVIVNEAVITQSQLDYRREGVLKDVESNGAEIPPLDVLDKQILDTMVSELLQVQEAERRNLAVSDAEVDAAIQRYASQQNLNVQQLKIAFSQRGESFNRFTKSVSDSLNISRLTEYYVRARVVVPDYEIEGFIAQNEIDSGGAEYQIAHILIKNPDENRLLAENVRTEIIEGVSFQQAVLTYSEATNAQEGGVLGWRTAAQLPEVFTEAIKTVNVGELTEVLETENGLHILKLLDIKGNREEILQHKVRHILISANTEVARTHANIRISEIKQRILAGEKFDELARIYSDDAVSAANGGDLEWVSPGEMVPQFEDAFNKIPLNEISEPFNTSYGVHILQVLDRRTKNITDELIRAQADNILRSRRAEREFEQWVRELESESYIYYLSEPA